MGIVRPKADGSGFYTTEKPERVYKTYKGAKQANRLFEDPSLQIQNKFYLEKIGDKEVHHKKPIEDYYIDPTLEQTSSNTNGSESSTEQTEKVGETFTDPDTNKKYILINDSTHTWNDLSSDWKKKINKADSDYKTKKEFIENEWEAHLSSFLDDVIEHKDNCPWSFSDVKIDIANEGDLEEVKEEET